MIKGNCEVEGCENVRRARAWCQKHYDKWRHYGDPLGSGAKLEVCAIESCTQTGRIKRGWCSRHYNRWRIHGDPLAPLPTTEDRFWRKVDMLGDDDCWEWQGSRNQSNYGKFSGGGYTSAHRYSYDLHFGTKLQSFEQVHHKCGNPPCVNPKHLEHVSAKENIGEMFQRNYFLRRIEYLEDLLKQNAIEYL